MKTIDLAELSPFSLLSISDIETISIWPRSITATGGRR
jgi:hypothetical protein